MYQFKIGDRVKPKSGYASDRRGEVVEVTPTRVRVKWEKQTNGVIGKRTWMAPKSLMLVITVPDPFPEPQPAVGPGGWILDTDE